MGHPFPITLHLPLGPCEMAPQSRTQADREASPAHAEAVDGGEEEEGGMGMPRQKAASALPSRECMQADIAQGTAARGSAGKCCNASTAPRALFCMPT